MSMMSMGIVMTKHSLEHVEKFPSTVLDYVQMYSYSYIMIIQFNSNPDCTNDHGKAVINYFNLPEWY